MYTLSHSNNGHDVTVSSVLRSTEMSKHTVVSQRENMHVVIKRFGSMPGAPVKTHYNILSTLIEG